MTKKPTLVQYLQGGLLLIYLACAARYMESLWIMLEIEALPLFAALLMVSGSAMLVLGVVRSLYQARLGSYLLTLAALQLVVAASRIGNWQYKVSQGMLATLVLGIVIALLGAWLAHRAKQGT